MKRKNIDKILLIMTAVPFLISMLILILILLRFVQDNSLEFLLFALFSLSFFNGIILLVFSLYNIK